MAALETTLCRKLGLKYPIVQAPIGSGTSPALVAAVSNAGGLGMHALIHKSPEETQTVIRETQAATERPFGVNFVVDPAMDQEQIDASLEVCLDAGVEVVSIAFGDAAPYIDRVHDADGAVMQSVGSVAEASAAVDAGADIIVAQGWEAGGHVQGEVATLPFIPRVVDAVEGTPVIAAGGIADGRGITAVLALGAVGAWLGTRFLATEEATVHERYKERVIKATEAETVYTELFDVPWSRPHRVLRNDTVEQWEAAGRPPVGERPGEDEIVAELPDGRPVKRYMTSIPRPGTSGDLEAMALYAGQSVGLAETLAPAAEVVDDLVTEASEAIRGLVSLIDASSDT